MNVCPDCFGVAGLQRRIREVRPDHDVGHCDLHPTKKGVPIEAVAEIIDPVFRDNYGGGIEDPYSIDPKGSPFDEVIDVLASPTDFDINEALQNALVEGDNYWPPDGEEAFYSDEYGYHRLTGGAEANGRLWREFRRSLIHGQRFFNLAAKDQIAAIFGEVQQQRAANKQGPVYIIEPGGEQGTFYRARVADEDAERAAIEKDLARSLGPPPERKRRAGRLNPAGVIGFYGAFDIDTCIAELRPSVGSTVIAAQFAITAPVCVLDLTRFAARPKEIDVYAKNARERAAQWAFMQEFMWEIARPISPGDEHLDYLPTQAVAEYLNQHHRFTFGGEERTIDAIIYPSAQHPGGKNIVLLGEAAVVGPPPDADPKPSDDVQKRWPGLKFQRQPKARIVPKPNTVEKRRVAGATFTSVRVYDVSDVEGLVFEGDI